MSNLSRNALTAFTATTLAVTMAGCREVTRPDANAPDWSELANDWPSPCVDPNSLNFTECEGMMTASVTMINFDEKSPTLMSDLNQVGSLTQQILDQATGGRIKLSIGVIPASEEAKTKLGEKIGDDDCIGRTPQTLRDTTGAAVDAAVSTMDEARQARILVAFTGLPDCFTNYPAQAWVLGASRLIELLLRPNNAPYMTDGDEEDRRKEERLEHVRNLAHELAHLFAAGHEGSLTVDGGRQAMYDAQHVQYDRSAIQAMKYDPYDGGPRALMGGGMAAWDVGFVPPLISAPVLEAVMQPYIANQQMEPLGLHLTEGGQPKTVEITGKPSQRFITAKLPESITFGQDANNAGMTFDSIAVVPVSLFGTVDIMLTGMNGGRMSTASFGALQFSTNEVTIAGVHLSIDRSATGKITVRQILRT